MPDLRKSILMPMAVVLLGCCSCKEELGPETMTTANVNGTVRFHDQPVGPGFLEFAPVDGTVGLVSSARLNADGTFRARHVPIGTVGIRLAGVRLPDAGSPTLNRTLFLMTQANLIHRRIEAARGDHLEIDLGDEAMRTAREMSR